MGPGPPKTCAGGHAPFGSPRAPGNRERSIRPTPAPACRSRRISVCACGWDPDCTAASSAARPSYLRSATKRSRGPGQWIHIRAENVPVHLKRLGPVRFNAENGEAKLLHEKTEHAEFELLKLAGARGSPRPSRRCGRPGGGPSAAPYRRSRRSPGTDASRIALAFSQAGDLFSAGFSAYLASNEPLGSTRRMVMRSSPGMPRTLSVRCNSSPESSPV